MTGVELLTALVFMVKLGPVVDPAATVTLDGTVTTDVSLLVSVTTAPPEGAAALSFTVPLIGFPPTTLAELKLSEETVTDEVEPVMPVRPRSLPIPVA